jgi:hypothetical protein
MLSQACAGRELTDDDAPVTLLDGAGFRERLLSLPLGGGGKIRA